MVAVRVMDRTGAPSALRVEVTWAPAFELLTQLNSFGSPRIQPTFDSGSPPFELLRTTLPPDLLRSLERLGPWGGKAWGTLTGLAWHERLRSSSDLIRHVEGMEPIELRLVLLGARWPNLRAVTPPQVMLDAARGDRAAAEELLANVRQVASDPEDESEALRHIASLGPEETRSAVVEALRGWNDHVFAAQEPALTEALQRDAERKRTLGREVSPERLIELATNGLAYTPQPWVRRVILIPHLAMRPWNLLNAWDDTTLVCYPAADDDAPADPDAPPARLIRLHKALGDEKRLRMLKVLARGTATLQQLADATGLAKSSAHHHTVILRAAGLITVTLEDTSRYALRRDPLPEVSGGLESFLEEGR